MNLNILVLAMIAMLLCVLAPGGVKCDDKPVKCFTDNDCVKAGKVNSYCRKQKKVIKVHHSECEPKRSKYHFSFYLNLKNFLNFVFLIF